ncbi:helix-turn-helix protein [Mucilaginibacter yixingensis]|uniref:Helix-turn-helix protein n=1 Tax=Mucilaginibacter yixingensis TaxID=1295612 RepID=A0A2T5J4E3_9SPHI|nr:helix-turn-helix transcriptional regulator [Mucilaginibacter yixingensis]PTQ92138.1 helix-turn-helix protein [Mucilaginibacter yixingensis]
MNTMDTIGEKIRIQRLIKNYSQEYMAFMLEISQPAYSNIESGKTEITLNRIYEIAEVLEISAYLLMPKPKYGTGINLHTFYHTLKKLGSLLSKPSQEKKMAAIQQGIVYRDISKNLD